MNEPSVMSVQRRPDEKFCSACGKILHQSALMCPGCGASQVIQGGIPAIEDQRNMRSSQLSGHKYCSGCGNQVHSTAVSCPRCGARQESSYVSNKSKTTAGMLALFLGGIGVHKFYLNKPIQGLLYLVFFWTLIPGIIALIEAIIYFSTSERDFARKYAS